MLPQDFCEVENEPEPEVIEDKPSVSELVKSLDLVKKYLQSHGSEDRELDSLMNLEKYAIKEKQTVNSVQTNIDQHFKVDKFRMASLKDFFQP